MVLSCKKMQKMQLVFDAWYKTAEAEYEPGVLRSYGIDDDWKESWLEFAQEKGFSKKDGWEFWEEFRK